MWAKEDWIKSYAIKSRLAEIALAELARFDINKTKELFQDYITQLTNNNKEKINEIDKNRN